MYECHGLVKIYTTGKGNANANNQGDHMSASISWLERWQSNLAVMGSSPGPTYIYVSATLRSR